MSAAFFRTLRSLATKGYKQCCGGFLSVMLFLGGWGPLDPVPHKWGWRGGTPPKWHPEVGVGDARACAAVSRSTA
jgi:hypothetical protein